MNHLKRLIATPTLVLGLGVAVFADSPPCAPGEIHTPCSSAQYTTEDSTAPGETQGPGFTDVVTAAGDALVDLLIF